jgi:hypothetical protein
VLAQGNQKAMFVTDQSLWLTRFKEAYAGRVDIGLNCIENPEQALELATKGGSYPIIFSDYELHDSSLDGIRFLSLCQERLPFSSRILLSSSLSKQRMVSLVEKREVTSYVINSADVNSILSATRVGIVSHKVNVIGNFIDAVGTPSFKDLDCDLKSLAEVMEKLKIEEMGTEKQEPFICDRRMEGENLLHDIKLISQAIPLALERQVKLQIEKEKSKKVFEQIDRVQLHLSSMSEFLMQSKKKYEEQDAFIVKSRAKIAETAAEIKRLKGEFIADLDE